MAKLIQKSGFLSKKRAGRYMKYIATRDGVEILDEDAEGIYMRYIATRPRAEKHEGHGLFGAELHVDLEKTMQELKAHEGNVWTIIYSLRREDAARLGYDNAESWRLTLLAHQNDFAETMQIPPEHLRWYAAFHDEGEHPHIHMMLWSDDPKYGFLRKDRLLHMQSVLTNTIYADELKEIYVQKDVAYKEVTEAARAVMRELVDRMESVSEPPASVQHILLDMDALARRQARPCPGWDCVCPAVTVNRHVRYFVDGLIGQTVVYANQDVRAAAVDDVLSFEPVEVIRGHLALFQIQQLLRVDLRIFFRLRAAAVADGDKREPEFVKVTEAVISNIPAEHTVADFIVLVTLFLPLLRGKIAERRQIALVFRAHGFKFF
ncbi:putative tetratricopeptide repeat containing protein [Firmicutes bacterium CAG:170]|nr:putative tetratricopeptide repeat containing protein [Firmicutes bacterium CAG:170]